MGCANQRTHEAHKTHTCWQCKYFRTPVHRKPCAQCCGDFLNYGQQLRVCQFIQKRAGR